MLKCREKYITNDSNDVFTCPTKVSPVSFFAGPSTANTTAAGMLGLSDTDGSHHTPAWSKHSPAVAPSHCTHVFFWGFS